MQKPIITTSTGAPIDDNQNSMTAGPRGPIIKAILSESIDPSQFKSKSIKADSNLIYVATSCVHCEIPIS